MPQFGLAVLTTGGIHLIWDHTDVIPDHIHLIQDHIVLIADGIVP